MSYKKRKEKRFSPGEQGKEWGMGLITTENEGGNIIKVFDWYFLDF